MAARFGVSDRTVRRLMAEPRAAYLARAQERREQAVALRAEGLTQAQIAARLGISRQSVSRLLQEAARATSQSDESTAQAS
ncbi:helix-turn-helix domain-containing protein [Kineococcus arenarius]|uniref:helix-turn-helix domain-containing protein n=2 Tax=Kineococcus TaxID=33981 RepID=UPI003D7DA888